MGRHDTNCLHCIVSWRTEAHFQSCYCPIERVRATHLLCLGCQAQEHEKEKREGEQRRGPREEAGWLVFWLPLRSPFVADNGIRICRRSRSVAGRCAIFSRFFGLQLLPRRGIHRCLHLSSTKFNPKTCAARIRPVEAPAITSYPIE